LVPVLNFLQGLFSQQLFGHWHVNAPYERSFAHAFEFAWPKLVIFLPLFYVVYASPWAEQDQAKFNAIHANHVLPSFNAWRGYFLAALLVVMCGALWIQNPHPLIAALVSIFGIMLMSFVIRMRLLRHAA
jgi:hypothetical protein